MQWDTIEFHVADCYLSALINGDTSGLDDAEESQVDAFEKYAHDCAPDGFTFGHFSTADDDNGEDFRVCDLSALYSGCVTLTAHYFRA